MQFNSKKNRLPLVLESPPLRDGLGEHCMEGTAPPQGQHVGPPTDTCQKAASNSYNCTEKRGNLKQKKVCEIVDEDENPTSGYPTVASLLTGFIVVFSHTSSVDSKLFYKMA